MARRKDSPPDGPASAAGTPELREPWDTVAGQTTCEIEVRRSRFLTALTPVSTAAEAHEQVAQARRRYWDARHNCSAFIVGPYGDYQHSSDDGEPSGTAGSPMLDVLRHAGVTDVVAVVTRYFGGILLGTGGLVRAYSDAVVQALELAPRVHRLWHIPFAVTVAPSEAGRLEGQIRVWAPAQNALVNATDYGSTQSTVNGSAPPDARGSLEHLVAAATGGNALVRWGEPQIVGTPALS